MEKSFKGINQRKGLITLTHREESIQELLPVEIHLKEDGSITDGPSFCILMVHAGIGVAGQLSLEMFNEGLEDIGYKLVKL